MTPTAVLKRERTELHVIRSANRLRFCFGRFSLEFQVPDDGFLGTSDFNAFLVSGE